VGGLRRWMRRVEAISKETNGRIVLLDTETNETFEVPKSAFLYVIASFDDDYEPAPEIAQLLPRLDRLVNRDTGERFWLSDQTHSGKTAANTMSEEDGHAT
jgi:hypothetical protein